MGRNSRRIKLAHGLKKIHAQKGKVKQVMLKKLVFKMGEVIITLSHKVQSSVIHGKEGQQQ